MSKKIRRLGTALKTKLAREALRRRSDRCRAGSEVSASPEPGLCLEEAAARRCDHGFLRRDQQGGEPGAEFFITELRVLTRGRARGDDRSPPRRSVGAAAMHPARIGALPGLSQAEGAAYQGVAPDAMA